MKILKFGGSSVADPECVRRVCGLVREAATRALEETAAPNWMIVLLMTVATSFVATALGGQPLIWTARWTASRHVVATMVVGMLLALVTQRVSRSKVTP